MMAKIFFLFWISLAFNCKEDVPSSEYKVVGVSDGDSFTVLQGSRTFRVRVFGIDAPEKGMPFAKASKQFLSKLCYEKSVRLKVVKKDRYGRLVSHVILPDSKDLGYEMVRNGMAWHYKHYSSDPKLAALELHARRNRIGLWRDANPVAPWQARTAHRRKAAKMRMR